MDEIDPFARTQAFSTTSVFDLADPPTPVPPAPPPPPSIGSAPAVPRRRRSRATAVLALLAVVAVAAAAVLGYLFWQQREQGVGQAEQSVTTFLAVRGNEAEVLFSSEDGRAEFEAIVAEAGTVVPRGEPDCTTVLGATYECTLDTDQGVIDLTVDEDPASGGGLEIVSATLR